MTKRVAAWALMLALSSSLVVNGEQGTAIEDRVVPDSTYSYFEPSADVEAIGASYSAIGPSAIQDVPSAVAPVSCGSVKQSNCSCGWFAGSEVTLFTPHTGSVNVPGLITVVPERNLGVGGRYWLGYRGTSGLGLQTRYWGFDQDSGAPAGLLGGSLSLNMQTWDAEVTQLLNRGCYSFDLSGGVRWAKVEDQVGAAISESFNGWGSTISAVARRRLGNGPFSLFGGARGSLLYGSHDVGIIILPVNSTQEVMPVLETQLGTEYTRVLPCGQVLFARAAFETQLWELPPTAIGLFDQNIGLVGASLGAGVRF